MLIKDSEVPCMFFSLPFISIIFTMSALRNSGGALGEKGKDCIRIPHKIHTITFSLEIEGGIIF